MKRVVGMVILAAACIALLATLSGPLQQWTTGTAQAQAPGFARFQVMDTGITVISGDGVNYPVVNGYVDLPSGVTWHQSLLTAGVIQRVYTELEVAGELVVNGGISGALNVENFMLPSIATKSFTYTSSSGVSGNALVIPPGEKAFIHSVMVNVTTNFDCTGDDCRMVVGDAADADGYIVLADAELQAADTEGTGFPAGWQGLSAPTLGAYLDLNHNAFPVIGGSSGYTMTFVVDEASGTTMAGGAATIYVIYTRFQ